MATTEYNPVLTQSQVDRLFDRIIRDPITSCWNWTGGLGHGYGVVGINGSVHQVHRLIYAFVFGAIPVGNTGIILHHKCENRQCANPWHVQLVSRQHHGLLSEKSPTCINARKTTCYREHTLPIDVKGRRRCKICAKEQMHTRYLAHREEILAKQKTRRDEINANARKRRLIHHDEINTKRRARYRSKHPK